MSRVAAQLEILVDGLLPPETSPIDEAAKLRLRLLIGASVFTGCIAIPYVFIYAMLFGAMLGALTLAIAAVHLLATPYVLRWTRSRLLAANWFLANMMAVLLTLTALDGGNSVAVFAFPILPMFASVAADNRTAMGWSVASVVAVLALAMAHAAGVAFPQELSETDHLIFEPAVAVGVVIAIAAPSMLYRALADHAYHQVAHKEAEIRAIVESAADGIVGLGPDGRITSTNAAGERVLGRPAADLVGQPLQALVEGAIGARGATAEVRVSQPDGTAIDAEITVQSIQAAGERRAVATLRDVTLRKEALRTIAEARDRAVEATRAKSGFLANMSHELRTPLNAIIGYSEMLIEDAADASPDMLGDLEKVSDAGRHLLALINDILDLSKIEAGRVELLLEWLVVSELVAGVGVTVGPLAEQNGDQVEIDVPEDVGRMHADATRVRQVLLNLLGNATKFTRGGRVGVRARRSTEGGVDWLTFEVWDTGIGIRPDKLDRVFDEFVQADASTTRQFGGTGLGLAITRRLCRLMGGEVTATSVVGEGSTFTVRLPAALRPGGAHERSFPPEPDVIVAEDAPLVVVIDDDADARELLRRTLMRGGFQAVLAADGAAGLDLCRQHVPAAVTLDVLMPGMDGWQVLGAMKAEPALAEIPVILVSMLDDRSIGFALGASHYLTKPVDRDALIGLLDRYRASEHAGLALVVEDDEMLRELVSRTLRRSGWTVATAANGAEGLASVRESRPDIVLLDLMMPVMDGFEFLANVRAAPELADLPVVVVTARDLSDDERAQLQQQAQRVLQKAVTSRKELLEQVRSAVTTYASRRTPVSV